MIEKLRENWDDILLYLKEEHDIMDVSYRTWLLPLQIYDADDQKVVIMVPDSAMIGYIKKKYGFQLDPNRNIIINPGSDNGLIFAMMP